MSPLLASLLLAATPGLSFTIVDVEALAAEELTRLQADLSFELERHTGLPVTASPLARTFPVEDAPPGLWVRAFRGVAQLRLILEDRRAGAAPKTDSADLEWPLSASRPAVQAMLTRLLGPAAIDGRGQAPLTRVSGPADAGSSSAGPMVLLVSGVVAAGVAVGFAGANFAARHSEAEAELRPDGQTGEAALLASGAFIAVGVAGLSLIGSALWAMAD